MNWLKKYWGFALILITTLPTPALAAPSIQSLISGLLGFANTILIPFLLGIAFLIFVFQAIRFFVATGETEEGRENAKNLALYSIGAFVFILAFWGLVNIVNNGVGLANDPCNPISDYLTDPYGKRAGISCYQPSEDVTKDPVSPTPPLIPSESPINTPDFDTDPSNPTQPNTPSIPDADYPPNEGSLVTFSDVLILEEAIRDDANVYFSNFIENDFGVNSEDIYALLSDIPGIRNNSIPPEERVLAMLRLKNMGVIPMSDISIYVERLNQYYDQEYDIPNITDIDSLQPQSISPVPITNETRINRDNSRNALRELFDTYNANANMGTLIDTDNVMRTLFLNGSPNATGVELLEEMADQPQYGLDQEILTLYTQLSNTFEVYNGTYDMVLIEQ